MIKKGFHRKKELFFEGFENTWKHIYNYGKTKIKKTR